MEMQYAGNLQVRPLKGMVQGRLVMIVITGTTQNCTLEFLHAGDSTWRTHPDFNGAHTAGTIVQTVRCPSATMRLNFAAPLGGNYFLSIAHENVPSE